MLKLCTTEEVKNKILNGARLLLAGNEAALSKLPEGQWIGGTTSYCMTDEGGMNIKDRIAVTELPDYVKSITIKKYDETSISGVYKDIPGQGFGFLIIPALTSVHFSFALNAPSYENFAVRPLIGWIAGIEAHNAEIASPKVYQGNNCEVIENGAVAMLIDLPEDKYAEINIVNIFKQGAGDLISFKESGFQITDALINGEKENFAQYLEKNKIDTRLPLVADYNGAMINISIRKTDKTSNRVEFYAPVFEGMEYRLASPIINYVAEFNKQMPHGESDKILFSCNCILNYLYSGLEGKQTDRITGPITFGEIAYQLLNQTMAYITIKDL